jgi:hypothetical protein
MKKENDLESGLLIQKSIKKIKKEEDQEDTENKKCITCVCIIGSTITTVICTCLLWLIIQYNK